jgi:hypothetical protein
MLDYFLIVQKRNNCTMNSNNFVNRVIIGKEQLEQLLQNSPNYLNSSVIQSQTDQPNRVGAWRKTAETMAAK